MPTAVSTKREAPAPRNGVNTPALFATIDAVKGAPSLAAFRFRARNRWVSGTCSETTIERFDGAGATHEHASTFTYRADHPAVLVGEDRGPTPIEFLLHGLASCICSGIGNIAAARGVTLTSVESTIEGDIDLQGILGLNKEVRNGYQQLRLQRGHRRRRAAVGARRHRRAGQGPLGGLRRADQRRAGRDRRRLGVAGHAADRHPRHRWRTGRARDEPLPVRPRHRPPRRRAWPDRRALAARAVGFAAAADAQLDDAAARLPLYRARPRWLHARARAGRAPRWLRRRPRRRRWSPAPQSPR